ncbi:TIGR04222 domain-containing membrane protein [Streptomyces spinoverrucosus]|uniref:TIGR04222 domain-containing membrane protein n=1 Tax=Streptomyces spinoverrucosus TaxID=284043 RepID=UPI0018C41F94|nr:TIGR04222 domain-containing membrane protein [Streptomyces spinoverrucosus]MBG0851496.1 TIGR04222 domain-containing membrane protein [Streptomyces spinoverrucosus]
MSEETRTGRLEPHEVGFLQGGPRAALRVAVLGLHLRGLVEAGKPGTLRKAAGFPPPDHPLEKAVRVGLYRPAGIRELPSRSAVRLALARMRRDLVAAGLLRPALPGPTRAARRHLAALRAQHPLPTRSDGLTDEEMLIAVALHGGRALAVLVPHFARSSGLVGRDALADEGRFPFGRGADLRRLYGAEEDPGEQNDGGTSGGYHYGGGGYGCGGGGGGGGD